MNENQNQEGQLNIELDQEVAEGTYSNLAIINHSMSEFIVDFINIMPGVPKAKVKSRIILTPQHAKRLVKALSDKAFTSLLACCGVKIILDFTFALGIPGIILIKSTINSDIE